MKALLYIVLFLILVGLDATCGTCVSKESTVNAVEKQGYSNIEVLDKNVFFVSWRGCSGSDDAMFTMKATNSVGKDVEIMACAGWPFKGVTVRTE